MLKVFFSFEVPLSLLRNVKAGGDSACAGVRCGEEAVPKIASMASASLSTSKAWAKAAMTRPLLA